VSDVLQPIVAEGNQYKVIGDLENGWHYYVYDKKGNVVVTGSEYRVPPDISYVDKNTIEICIHGGTYADLCRYYNVETNQLSADFQNPFLTTNNLIVYYDGDSGELIIRNIYNRNVFYKQYKRDISLSVPPIDISFLNDYKELSIKYYTKEDTVVSETLSLH